MTTFKRFSALILFLTLTLTLAYSQSGNDFAKRRAYMVDTTIEARGISDQEVLTAMRQVPRHLFVPVEYQTSAYEDHPLPIGLGQTISQPFIVAYMSELLETDTTQKVLEIGTGSGYQAAILSGLVSQVYTIEIVPELGLQAKERLKTLGYTNVEVRIGDGYQGWPDKAPFDRIIVTAAPEKVPPRLVEQLKPGGRMVIPTGPQRWGQDLLIVEKSLDGSVNIKKTIPVRFVPMVRE